MKLPFLVGCITAFLVVAGYFVFGTDKTSAPDTALPDGQMVAVTLPKTLSTEAQLGQKFFDVKCVACHGANAAGVEGAGPPLIHIIYEPNHHGDAAFYSAAANGVRAHHWKFGDMPAVPDVTLGEVKPIVTYIRELQRANGIN